MSHANISSNLTSTTSSGIKFYGNEGLMYGSLLFISSAGIMGALLVLCLSIFSPKLREGDYKYFICNIAFVGLLTETTWLVYLVAQSLKAVVRTSVPLTYAIAISMFSSYLTALTAPLPATISRFILFRKPMGIVQFRRLFTKKRMLLYFLVCDCYPYLITIIATVSNSISVSLTFATIFMISFIACYILVVYFAYVLTRTIRKYMANQERLNIPTHDEKRLVAKAFLYLGVLPLCCQFFHLVYAFLYIYAIYWGNERRSSFFTSLLTYLTNIIMYGIAINPVVDIIIIFCIIKPYKTALMAIVGKICCKCKRDNATSVADLATLPNVDRINRRRSTKMIATTHDG
uniref:G-protein coupled receptors family 1 profile domain-containing protein n=1 Tax=Plectus sambesii TaxID=2011161 RepID=A0A914VQX1_9BILA